MFAKSFSAAVVLVLSLSLQACGHALIKPAIGVTGAGARSDVQQPSTATPCGSNVNVANALKTSTAVKASGDAFTVSIENFNGGQDGSQEITSALVDTTATGTSFKGTATITKNGVLAPATTSTVQIQGTLPSGTKCTGGPDGASCLVSFKTAGGFGNCVLISQGSGSGSGSGAGSDTSSVASSSTTKTTSTSTSTTSTKTISTSTSTHSTSTTTHVMSTTTSSAAASETSSSKKKGKGHKKTKTCNPGGTRAARALKLVKARADEEAALAKRDESWVWA